MTAALHSKGSGFVSNDGRSDPAMDKEFAAERRELTYNTYHVIKAFKDAVERSGIDGRTAEDLKEQVFRRNAEALFEGWCPASG